MAGNIMHSTGVHIYALHGSAQYNGPLKEVLSGPRAAAGVPQTMTIRWDSRDRMYSCVCASTPARAAGGVRGVRGADPTSLQVTTGLPHGRLQAQSGSSQGRCTAGARLPTCTARHHACCGPWPNIVCHGHTRCGHSPKPGLMRDTIPGVGHDLSVLSVWAVIGPSSQPDAVERLR